MRKFNAFSATTDMPDVSPQLSFACGSRCRIINSRRHNGASSVLAFLFVALFSVLAVSFTAITNTNVQISHNHYQVSQTIAATQSGLAYADGLISTYIENNHPYTYGQSLTREDYENLFDGFFNYAVCMLEGADVLNDDSLSPISAFSDNGLTGRQFSVPLVTFFPNGNSRFTLLFRQYDDAPELIQVFSEGVTDDIHRRARLNHVVLKQPSGIFDFALFAKDSLSLKNGVTIDAVNMAPGDAPLQVGTNGIDSGDITLKNSATIEGDVVIGPGGDIDDVIDMASGASITGSTSTLSETWEMPPVQVPPALSGGSSMGSINATTTITSSGRYDSIDLGNSETVTINGNIELYITGDIDLGNSAELIIAPGARLTLYLGGDLVMCNSSELNNQSQDATNLIILGLETCESIILKNSGVMYASIYAPDADVDYRNSAAMYGAVVANSFLQHNSADFHYDAKLRDTEITGVCSYIFISCDGSSYVEF